MHGSFKRYAIIAADKEKRQYWSIFGNGSKSVYECACHFIDCLLSLVSVDFTTANKSWINVHCEHSNKFSRKTKNNFSRWPSHNYGNKSRSVKTVKTNQNCPCVHVKKNKWGEYVVEHILQSINTVMIYNHTMTTVPNVQILQCIVVFECLL